MLDRQANRKNNLIRWCITIGSLLFTCLSALILYIDFDLLRNPNLVKDHHLHLLLILLSGIITLVIIRRLIDAMANRLNAKYFKRFTELKNVGTYEESRARVHGGTHAKIEHSVLLLHGFTCSSQDYEYLIPALEKDDIPYLSVNMTGFGANTTKLLKNSRYQDWFCRALEGYDILKSFSNKVSIIGHSMGSILAFFVAQQRQPHRIIASGPGIFSVPEDLKYKKILQFPCVAKAFSWMIPYLPKPIRRGRPTTSDTCDPTMVDSVFQYLAVPINSVVQLFLAQDIVINHIDKTHYNRLIVLHGKHDLITVRHKNA